MNTSASLSRITAHMPASVAAPSQPMRTPTHQVFAGYTFVRVSHVVVFGEHRVALRPLEYELALYLFTNHGRLVSREEIWKNLWQRSPKSNMRTIDAHISKLRRLLRINESDLFCLESIHGKGYRLLYFDAPVDREVGTRER